ncbi:MAG: PIN domain-containing protein [Gammaproteobacteria bacterium]|nr:MAG: PIN domain-containing protein [Gammaproteobacteria bacterium]
MEIIIDTNILVAIFLRGNRQSYSYQLLAKCLAGEFKPQISNALFNEYQEVLYRDSVMASSIYSVKERRLVLEELYFRSEWSNIYYLWRPNLPDEGDNHLIELAIASGTKYIVTMNHRDFRGELKTGIHIVKPKEMLNEVKNGNTNL